MFTTYRYTFFGATAILLWSCLVALTRSVAEQLGAIGGAATIYTVASVLLLVTLGIPKLRQFSLSYIVIGGGLFACYEVFFSLALGFANDRQQTLEMAIINYLWPSLTVLLAVIGSPKKVSAWIYPAIAVAFLGVIWSITGDEGFSLPQLLSNIASNPVAYFLAFSGAFIWAIYCNVTRRLSNGQNGITLFFIFTAVTLWIHYAFVDAPPMKYTVKNVFDVVLASAFMAGGYGLWNIAIIGGNMVFLATLSYFTPVLSTFLSMLILGVSLSSTFWQGVAMVTLGSLICWRITQ
ncbi:aromatic amino acid DMT transporter YddG [Vibrio sp. JC009]|uniref:aromatic amino acid DMT transporter YddG n=1 Tax=Vibrio sp. JC009 TaxID=2912314 RepID=UPI0023AF1FA5|nr:aromatic amino acid DMT transporter YddG [Vibrio sp. JC009]WED20844.1 aromatic amino acid DMT transporter YddG [Vibrio sp. JC009]